jgi:membrane-associated phospholipid phosphatase
MPLVGSMRSARLISAVLNAPLIAAITFTVLVAVDGSTSWPTLLFITVLYSAVVPIAILYFLARMKVIPDMYASDQGSRTLPFLAAVASYGAGFVLLLSVGAPPLISALMLCYMVNTTIMTLITLVWKISIHASGVAGPAAAFGFALGPVGYLFLLLIIPVGWARVTLGAHSPVQVAAGALIAVTLTFFELGICVPFL